MHALMQSELNVLELATSTLTMFSQRPSASRALYDSGITSLAVKLLSPLLPTVSLGPPLPRHTLNWRRPQLLLRCHLERALTM